MKDIDWDLLRSRHPRGPRKQSSREDWDKKAVDFTARTQNSSYAHKFLSLMKPQKNWRVLDVGSGPGTLALPLASIVSHVSCLDFSQKMLDIVEDSARRAAITNISTHHLGWDDPWEQRGIAPHHIVIASRSLNLPALRPALEKLSRFACDQVFITDRVDSGPHDPTAFEAVGRKLTPGPDYIYTLNILHQMGFHARVDFIEAEPTSTYSSFKQAYQSYSWMFGAMDETEKVKLREYVTSLGQFHRDNSVTIQRNHRATWAFIHWRPRLSPDSRRACNNSRNDL